MANIAIFHPDLTLLGGGEAVCMNTLAALERDHDVTLVTMSMPKFETLNEYYNTEVTDTAVEQFEPVGTGLRWLGKTVSTVTGRRLVRLQSSILKRVLDREEFDLVFSTFNEFSFSRSAVQYIHYPNADTSEKSSILQKYYDLCSVVEGRDDNQIRGTTLLANSGWTAERVEEVYDLRPKVLYPPVDTSEFERIAWNDREQGFVTIGRIEPSKKLLRTIRIVARLQERGHDVHLHIVGPTTFESYGQKVEKAAEANDFIFLEGKIPRSKLVDLICTHRFGIHGKENEHFGMTVAELVAGGTIPFVPDTGGQCEVVNNMSDLCYTDEDDAVNKIDSVISGSSTEGIRSGLPDVEAKYGRKRFRDDVRNIVCEKLAAD